MAPAPGWGPEQGLRNAIQEFAFQPRFKDDFQRALPLFFGEEVTRTRTLVADEEDMPAFQEWYFFDFLTESGESIIDIFAREQGPELPARERALLDLWRHWNRYHLFEVQEVKPGFGVVVVDLLSGETLEVQDHSASRSLVRWTLFLARTLYTDRLHFTGAGIILSPLKKDVVLQYARQLWADYQTQHPQATLDGFYQRHGLDIGQFMKKKAAERPIYITPEGHPVEICAARYHVADGRAVAERLKQAEEFNFAGPSGEHATALHFNWLLRGSSYIPERPKPDDEALIQETFWFEKPGGPRYLNLGDVTLWPDRMELQCVSRARLKAGKALLERLLGRLVHHHGDNIRSLDDLMAHRPAKAPARNALPPDIAAAATEDIKALQIHNVLDEPVPALGGKTGRQAVLDPAGRALLIEQLKKLEYIQEENRREGKPWFDVDEIRRELGLK